jgi:hypothetical protein
MLWPCAKKAFGAKEGWRRSSLMWRHIPCHYNYEFPLMLIHLCTLFASLVVVINRVIRHLKYQEVVFSLGVAFSRVLLMCVGHVTWVRTLKFIRWMRTLQTARTLRLPWHPSKIIISSEHKSQNINKSHMVDVIGMMAYHVHPASISDVTSMLSKCAWILNQ